MTLHQAYKSLQRFARKQGCSVRVRQDEYGNVDFGVFDGKVCRGDEPFCVSSVVDHEQDFTWVDDIKLGIQQYRAEHPLV